MKIVYFGTPEIAVKPLEYLIGKDDIEVLAVITQPDKPAGRGKKVLPPPVKECAEKHKINVFQPRLIRKDENLINSLREMKPDAFITVAFGQILSKELLDIPRLGTINLHASLLPKYRGPNPIQWTIINGDTSSGITTMLSDEGIDTGPMLIKKQIELSDSLDSVELAEKISEIGGEYLYESIVKLNKGEITPEKQDDTQATYAPKLKKEDSIINWQDSSQAIHNKARGMKPWPGSTTSYKEAQIKIVETEIIKDKKNINQSNVGEITGIINGGIAVITGEGLILVKKLQPAGKKVMDAASWYNGARVQKGDKFQ